MRISFLGGYIILTSMITQYLEHALLSSGLLCKLCRTKMNHENAKELFYQIYWTIAVIFTISSFLWLVVTGRTGAKWFYGIFFMIIWLLLQVGLALVATSGQGPLQKYFFESKTEKKQQKSENIQSKA
jgi:hypothetical protein